MKCWNYYAFHQSAQKASVKMICANVRNWLKNDCLIPEPTRLKLWKRRGIPLYMPKRSLILLNLLYLYMDIMMYNLRNLLNYGIADLLTPLLKKVKFMPEEVLMIRANSTCMLRQWRYLQRPTVWKPTSS